MSDLPEMFEAAYHEFDVKKKAALALGPTQQLWEGGTIFHRKLVVWLSDHKGTGNAQEVAFREAQLAGRACMRIFTDNIEHIRQHEQMFMDHGYKQISAVYMFTASMDALDYKLKTAHPDVMFRNWAEVAALNLEENNMCVAFLRHYWDVRQGIRYNEAHTDPFDFKLLRGAFSDIAICDVAPSLDQDRTRGKYQWAW